MAARLLERVGAWFPRPRPRLTVSVLTKDSEPRLGQLLAEVSAFADEVLVGVDADSTDRTLAVARAGADFVYQFRHAGRFAPARMLPLEHASGDWILSLDDDERLEGPFAELAPELLADQTVTHYWFPRKLLAALDPCEYYAAPPWYPDWQRRLFRNDRRLVYKPDRVHTGYWVSGPGSYEERVSILHFEQVVCPPARRAEKLELYRRAAAPGDVLINLPTPETPRKPASLPGVPPRPRRRAGALHPEVLELPPRGEPRWGAEFLEAHVPAEIPAGAARPVDVVVRNTGATWVPSPQGYSPNLNLSYHLRDGRGGLLAWDNPRYAVPRRVPTGQSVRFLFPLAAPASPGEYQLEWDMVSEGEWWFSSVGGRTLTTPLKVV